MKQQGRPVKKGGPSGQTAPAARILFSDDPCRNYALDFLVTPGLNGRNYGLLSLRDILRHFAIRTAGGHQFGPNGEPVALPILELIPRGP